MSQPLIIYQSPVLGGLLSSVHGVAITVGCFQLSCFFFCLSPLLFSPIVSSRFCCCSILLPTLVRSLSRLDPRSAQSLVVTRSQTIRVVGCVLGCGCTRPISSCLATRAARKACFDHSDSDTTNDDDIVLCNEIIGQGVIAMMMMIIIIIMTSRGSGSSQCGCSGQFACFAFCTTWRDGIGQRGLYASNNNLSSARCFR